MQRYRRLNIRYREKVSKNDKKSDVAQECTSGERFGYILGGTYVCLTLGIITGESMVHGVRASISFTSGLVFGVLLSVLLFLPDELIELRKSDEEPSTDHWEVIIKKAAVTTTNGQSQIRKIIRAGFVATELGIREKLAVILLGQSSLMMALNASIGHYVPHLQVLLIFLVLIMI
ncbi:Chondroitin N-acetylgalactosaminyltransferase [Dirofilaria immitis]|nr:Chondroitin N-acetylgalactosaminyltransferase [Dirofilaria immitis]